MWLTCAQAVQVEKTGRSNAGVMYRRAPADLTRRGAATSAPLACHWLARRWLACALLGQLSPVYRRPLLGRPSSRRTTIPRYYCCFLPSMFECSWAIAQGSSTDALARATSSRRAAVGWRAARAPGGGEQREGRGREGGEGCGREGAGSQATDTNKITLGILPLPLLCAPLLSLDNKPALLRARWAASKLRLVPELNHADHPAKTDENRRSLRSGHTRALISSGRPAHATPRDTPATEAPHRVPQRGRKTRRARPHNAHAMALRSSAEMRHRSAKRAALLSRHQH